MSIPVILDTDIGFDVDDVWALAFLLRCPELDLKLVVTNSGDTTYSAAVVAKLLEAAGRTDVPVGVGPPIDTIPRTHAEWLADYSLSDYSGTVHQDGVGALIETVHANPGIAVVCIGPLANIAAALGRDSSITRNSRFVGMHGSLRRGYLGADKPMKEYNVKKHTAACQKVFSTPWDLTITPLDTCGVVRLKGADFARVAGSDSALAKAVIENHLGWFEAVKDWPVLSDLDATRESSVLYDTVAVYLAFSEELVEMETLPVEVTDDAKTLVAEGGQRVNCAMSWRDLAAFEKLVSERLAS